MIGTGAALVSLGATIIGGAISSNTAAKGRNAANNLAERGAAAFDSAKVPGLEEQKALLEEFKVTGQYTPEMVETFGQDPSAMEQVVADKEVVQQQQDALAQMAEISEGGYSEGDKAGMREIKNEINQNARARQKSILNEMAQRGVLGSGMELAAQLKGEQQSIDSEASASNRAIQQAQARSLQAIGQSGSMASQLRSQDVGEQTNIARAKDAINRFNTANRQSVAGQNVGTRNQAQAANLATQQATADANVGMRNQEELRQKGLIQQQFQNQMEKASGQAGQYNAQAKNVLDSSNAQAEQQAGIASGLVNLVGSFGDAKDKLRKKDQDDAMDNL